MVEAVVLPSTVAILAVRGVIQTPTVLDDVVIMTILLLEQAAAKRGRR